MNDQNLLLGQNNGNAIEREVIRRTNGMKINELDPEMKHFIISVGVTSEKHTGPVGVRKSTGSRSAKKSDLEILINEKVLSRVSVKSGSGNSVHQESIYDFVQFLEAHGASRTELDSLLLFHWGDGTLDGSGRISDRLSASKIRATYPEAIVVVDSLFTRLTPEIAHRALAGNDRATEPGYISYFPDITLKDGVHVQMKDAIGFHSRIQNSHDDLKIGNLNFQAYQRCLQGQDTYSSKTRNDIQVKWSNLVEDLKVICGRN
jgi:hypothetical protein